MKLSRNLLAVALAGFTFIGCGSPESFKTNSNEIGLHAHIYQATERARKHHGKVVENENYLDIDGDGRDDPYILFEDGTVYLSPSTQTVSLGYGSDQRIWKQTSKAKIDAARTEFRVSI